MQFTIGTITRCTGGNHWHVPITINGVTRNLETTTDELQDAAPDNHEEARKAILHRIRSAILEAGANTPAQAMAALNNKTFKV